jgi:hypothetical protein
MASSCAHATLPWDARTECPADVDLAQALVKILRRLDASPVLVEHAGPFCNKLPIEVSLVYLTPPDETAARKEAEMVANELLRLDPKPSDDFAISIETKPSIFVDRQMFPVLARLTVTAANGGQTWESFFANPRERWAQYTKPCVLPSGAACL